MLNLYTPFPRYENIIIVGDTAAEALATLRIWGRALVGGDIPGMEVLHPAEKMLECTHCAMWDRPKILDAAARRLGVDFILLEENGLPDLNPARMKADLEREGFTVKVLDVRRSAVEVLRRAGALMGEEKHAERMVSDWETRMARLQELRAASPLPSAASLALPVLKKVGTVERPVLLPLPWHCRPMMWRLPRSMEVWYGTLKGI